MDPSKIPSLDKAETHFVGATPPDRRARSRLGILGVALLAGLAATAAITSSTTPDGPVQQAQAQVVAKFVFHDAASLQSKGPGAWQQAQEGLQARHNLILELDGRTAVVSVSPEVFTSVCTHLTENETARWDGAVGCGTVHDPAHASPPVQVDQLDRIDVAASVDASNQLVIHDLNGAKPAASGFFDRMDLRRDLKIKRGNPSI